MREETTTDRQDHIAALCGSATFAFAVLIMGAYRLFVGPVPAVDSLPLTENWDLAVFSTGRGWDLLVAPIWAILLTQSLIESGHDGRPRLTPLFGLLTAGVLYLFAWGEPGIAVWLSLPLVAIIEARILDLIDRRRIAAAGLPAPPHFGIGDALKFCLSFGFGLFLPFAAIHGFMLTVMVPFLGYAVISLVLCTVVFGTLGALRLAASLWRRLTRKDRHWTWKSLGVSNLVKEHEAAPDFKLSERTADDDRRTDEDDKG